MIYRLLYNQSAHTWIEIQPVSAELAEFCFMYGRQREIQPDVWTVKEQQQTDNVSCLPNMLSARFLSHICMQLN